MDSDAPKTGRPSMCGSCGHCQRCKRAAYMRQWWANLSPEEKREKTARRDAARVKADHRRKMARRYHEGTDEQRAKMRARAAVRQLQPGSCERVSTSCAGRIEAHHEDYSRPLDVTWLCRHHHAEVEGRWVACSEAA